ncbi:MAG: hypothetical protein QXG35_08135 [Nitrososphaerota archaeon]
MRSSRSPGAMHVYTIFGGRLTLFCEEPEPFGVFISNDGFLARRAANEKGLVALFLGRSPACEGAYAFLALPSGLAEQIITGENPSLRGLPPHVRDALTTAGRKLGDPETLRDIAGQLRYIAYGR